MHMACKQNMSLTRLRASAASLLCKLSVLCKGGKSENYMKRKLILTAVVTAILSVILSFLAMEMR
jgi:hypothetical protein